MRSLIVSGAVVLTLAACSSPDDAEPVPAGTTHAAPVATTPAPRPTPAVVYPGSTWERDEQGDFGALDAELQRHGSTCVAVVKDGKLVHDAYWNGGAPDVKHRVYSITKSLAALLVGTFVGDSLDLDASASLQVDEWRGTSAEDVTVRDLLAMTSGRHFDDATDRQMIRSEDDKTSFSVGLAQDRDPGREWVYDNSAVQTLESVVQELAGTDDVVGIADDRLIGPLGMRDTAWTRDAAGNALTYSGVESTCQDLARVGHLMLNEGRWKGEQVVPSGFVQEATSPSSDLNAAYGLLWWVNAEGRIVEVLRQAGFATDKVPYEGRLAPNVPDDAYWAFGYGNQYVAVIPSQGVVAVRLGARPASPDQVTFDGFTAGVLDALGS